jgi:hypothetical protein
MSQLILPTRRSFLGWTAALVAVAASPLFVRQLVKPVIYVDVRLAQPMTAKQLAQMSDADRQIVLGMMLRQGMEIPPPPPGWGEAA